MDHVAECIRHSDEDDPNERRPPESDRLLLDGGRRRRRRHRLRGEMLHHIDLHGLRLRTALARRGRPRLVAAEERGSRGHDREGRAGRWRRSRHVEGELYRCHGRWGVGGAAETSRTAATRRPRAPERRRAERAKAGGALDMRKPCWQPRRDVIAQWKCTRRNHDVSHYLVTPHLQSILHMHQEGAPQNICPAPLCWSSVRSTARGVRCRICPMTRTRRSLRCCSRRRAASSTESLATPSSTAACARSSRARIRHTPSCAALAMAS